MNDLWSPANLLHYLKANCVMSFMTFQKPMQIQTVIDSYVCFDSPNLRTLFLYFLYCLLFCSAGRTLCGIYIGVIL